MFALKLTELAPEILEIVESLTTLGGIAVGVFGLISGNPFLAALFFP